MSLYSCLYTQPFIYLFIYNLLIYLCIFSRLIPYSFFFIHHFSSFIHLWILLSNYLFIYIVIHSYIHSFNYSYLNRLSMYLCIHFSLIHLSIFFFVIHSFIHTLIYLFISRLFVNSVLESIAKITYVNLCHVYWIWPFILIELLLRWVKSW